MQKFKEANNRLGKMCLGVSTITQEKTTKETFEEGSMLVEEGLKNIFEDKNEDNVHIEVLPMMEPMYLLALLISIRYHAFYYLNEHLNMARALKLADLAIELFEDTEAKIYKSLIYTDLQKDPANGVPILMEIISVFDSETEPQLTLRDDKSAQYLGFAYGTLADAHYRGKNGAFRNYEKAMFYANKGIQLSDFVSLNIAALIHIRQLLPISDPKQGIDFLQVGVAKGNPDSMVLLSKCYFFWKIC